MPKAMQGMTALLGWKRWAAPMKGFGSDMVGRRTGESGRGLFGFALLRLTKVSLRLQIGAEKL
jgi:hypothetical protein